MGIKPRYLILAAVGAGALYALGVSVGTLIFVLALAFMGSMHLGHGGGHGGDGYSGGGGGGRDLQSKPASDTGQTPSRQEPPGGQGHVGHR